MLRRLGVQVDDSDASEVHPPAWDGKVLVTADMDWDDLYHEAAHYQVARPCDRKKREYGFDSRYDGPSEMRKYEEQASLLGILWMRHHGWSWYPTFYSHNWDWSLGNGLLEKRLAELYAAGFITSTGRPLFVVR